jgi:hypothetical protein
LLPLDPSELYAEWKRPTQIEEDPHRVKQSRFRYNATTRFSSDSSLESSNVLLAHSSCGYQFLVVIAEDHLWAVVAPGHHAISAVGSTGQVADIPSQ